MSATFDRLRFPADYLRLGAGTPCALDTLVPLDANLVPLETRPACVFPIGTQAQFRGWAVAPVLGGYALPAAVMVVIGHDVLRMNATLGIVRDDVARDLGDSRLEGAGFHGMRAIDVPKPGTYPLSLIVVTQERTYYETPLAREIEIVESRRQFPELPESDRIAIASVALAPMHPSPRGSAGDRFRRGEIIVVRGQAFEREAQVAASRVFAIVDDEHYVGGVVGLPNDQGERFAFSVRLATKNLRTGSHALRIAALTSDGLSVTLGPQTNFVLRGA